MQEIDRFETLVEKILSADSANARIVVAIAGAPGGGKSTLAARLVDVLRESLSADAAALLPMDGFHLDNAVLDARGQRERKGAPFTFDVAGYLSALARLRDKEAEVFVPRFDRAADCARAAAIRIGPEHRFVVSEGNYLLLDQPPWNRVVEHVDMTVFIDTPLAELERRLVQRWLDHGLPEEEARRRAMSNDLPNARLIFEHSRPADFLIANS